MILAPLAAFLVWEVLTRSLAAYLADAGPEAALRLWSTNPAALLNLADLRLKSELKSATTHRDEADAPGETEQPNLNPASSNQGVTLNDRPKSPGRAEIGAETQAKIRSWAEQALLNDPLNARAFRILGQLSQLTSENKQTEALMQGAVRRSLLESVAVYWMMRKSYEDQDYSGALRYVDILLRTRPQFLGSLMPVIGKTAEIPDASAQLKQLLATNPPWRSQCFGLFACECLRC